MARIAFSCCGEGQGHSSRTLAISRALIRHGHEVMILAARKAFTVLQSKLPQVHCIPGLFIVYVDNQVNLWNTIKGNAAVLLKKRETIGNIIALLKEFKPDFAITDFEPFLPAAAKRLGIPYISLDHQHVIPHLRLELPLSLWGEYLGTRAIVALTHQGELANLVTSFFYPEPPYEPHLHFLPPILREEVQELKITNQGHVVVYQTSSSFVRLPELLKQLPFQFIVYAFDREGTDGNVTYKPRATTSFLEDVASADWILTNGGYTLMSESLFLGKPVFSVPVEKQFEQWINAHFLAKLKYGLSCSSRDLTLDKLHEFITRREEFRTNIGQGEFNGNEQAVRKVLSYVEQVKPSSLEMTPVGPKV